MLPIHIRRCTVDDAPELAALARRTFHETFEGTCTEADMDQFLNTVYNEDRIRTELSRQDDFCFFAEGASGGGPIAFIRFLPGPLAFPSEGRRSVAITCSGSASGSTITGRRHSIAGMVFALRVIPIRSLSAIHRRRTSGGRFGSIRRPLT